jgi:hypothetical protein
VSVVADGVADNLGSGRPAGVAEPTGPGAGPAAVR